MNDKLPLLPLNAEKVLQRGVLVTGFRLFCLISMCAMPAATFGGIEPMGTSTGNFSPLAQLYGLPQLSAQTPLQSAIENQHYGASQHSLGVNLTLTSVSHQSSNPVESVLLDGEIMNLSFRYQRELTFSPRIKNFLQLSRPRIGLYVPYIYHGSGFMDAGIAKWHDWLGLPNGNRDHRPNNTLRYRYRRNGVPLVSIAEDQSGLGDMQLQFAASSIFDETRAQRLHIALGIKLPSGSQTKLTGSNGTDIYFTAAIDNPLDLSNWAINSTISASYLRIEPSGSLAEITKKNVFTGQFFVSRPISRNWRASISLNYNEAIHRSALEAVGEDALTGSLYATHRWPKQSLSLGIIEDIFVDNSQDFSLSLSWQTHLD